MILVCSVLIVQTSNLLLKAVQMHFMTVGWVDLFVQGDGWEGASRCYWLACNGFITIMLMQHKTLHLVGSILQAEKDA